MKHTIMTLLAILLLLFSCSSNKTTTQQDSAKLDKIFFDNKSKPFDERTYIKQYYSERDSCTRGSFSIQEGYWADIVYHEQNDKLEIYINDKLSNSLIDSRYGTIYLPADGYYVPTLHDSDTKILCFNAKLIPGSTSAFTYCHRFVEEEERYVFCYNEDEELKKPKYQSIANTIGVLEYENKEQYEMGEDILLIDSDSTTWFAINDLFSGTDGLDPLFINAYMGHIAFTCVAEDEASFTVIVDEKTKDTKRISKEQNVSFITWQEFVKKHKVSPIANTFTLDDKPISHPRYAPLRFRVSELEDNRAYLIQQTQDPCERWIDAKPEHRLEGCTEWLRNDTLLFQIHHDFEFPLELICDEEEK